MWKLRHFHATLVLVVMKGAGTADDTLIRVIVTRCEVDMVQIKQEYQRSHGRTLEAAIEVFGQRVTLLKSFPSSVVFAYVCVFLSQANIIVYFHSILFFLIIYVAL